MTARRKEEGAQSVPIAMTKFTTETLQKQDIRSGLELLHDVPEQSGATGASLGLNYTFLRSGPGVISYFNDVPVNSNFQNQGYFFDTDSLEALKGPAAAIASDSNYHLGALSVVLEMS